MSAAKTKAQNLINENAVGASPSAPTPSRSNHPKGKECPLTSDVTVVFSKSYCPYCAASKKTLRDLGAKFYALELDEIGSFPSPSPFRPEWLEWIKRRGADCDVMVDDGTEIQNALYEMTQQRTVPNIFIGQKHIGGNSDLQAKSAQLPALLKEAGAL